MESWLKGGLWGLLVGTIYFLLLAITLSSGSDPSESGGISALMGIISFILLTPFSIFSYFLRSASVTMLLIKLFFIVFITFFILGTILGGVYGWMKRRKHPETYNRESKI